MSSHPDADFNFQDSHTTVGDDYRPSHLPPADHHPTGDQRAQALHPSRQPGSSSERSEGLLKHPVYVALHGHFYQPPREHPSLNMIERQPSAAPFHDWNERILAECYRPNAFARILDDQGNVVQIVNNYEYLSFNFGPTLLSWIEQHDMEVYQRILAADRISAARLEGHGNAIAQVYNHVILPLANQRDKHTQIRWGIADFQARFGRHPEGMWLAETAIDAATVAALIAEGIRFVILAPSQAERYRPLGSSQWQDVSDGRIDPTRPYRCYTADRQHYLDIFFFDGPISADLGFSDIVYNSHYLSNRWCGAIDADRDHAQLIHCATDGETFGHHKKGVERTLAYAFTQEVPNRGWQVVNYGYYLSRHPSTCEVQLKPVTAWSCSHGVDRWQADCGCGGGGGWQQQWRQPLRLALNWLRDQLVTVYVTEAEKVLRDPWLARDHYIEVILNREQAILFLHQHQVRQLTAQEQIDALRLLEMQRYSQLMFTSCGWFFEELSRPETVQILRYAARAIELAGEVAGLDLEAEFIDRLTSAPSNIAQFRNGEAVYRSLVQPSLVSTAKVVAKQAMLTLFSHNQRHTDLRGYTLEQTDREWRSFGSASLAVGRMRLQSLLTLETEDLIYAVLHLGGWDFLCGVRVFPGRRSYEEIKARLLGAQFQRAELVLAIQALFGHETFNMSDLMAEERHRMMQLLTQDTLNQLGQLYRQTYLDHYSILAAFRADGLPIPPELLAAAQITLNQRLTACVWRLEAEEDGYDHVMELRAIAQDADQLGCQLRWVEVGKALDRLLHRCLWQLAHAFEPESFGDQLHSLQHWLHLASELKIPIALDRLQELYFACLENQIVPRCPAWPQQACRDIATGSLIQLLQLGQLLRVNITRWMVKVQS